MTRFTHYQTDRLSKIPNMVSVISKRIADFQLNYRKMLEEAALFFIKHHEYEAELKKLNANVLTYEEHIKIKREAANYQRSAICTALSR